MIDMFHTTGAEKALSAAGAYALSDASLRIAGGLPSASLVVAYDPAAIGGYPVILPQVSYEADEPAAGDDAWFFLPTNDGVVTETVLTGALPGGSDFTLQPNVGVMSVRPLAVKPCAAAVATADEVRQVVTIDLASVPRARWLRFLAAEVGVTASPGSLLVRGTV